MRTVLCSTTAGRGVLLLALVAGTVGGTLALPASAADRGDTSSAGSGPHRQVSAPHRMHGPAAGAGRRGGRGGATVLGPAVTYVRLPDGTIRKVR